MLNLQLQGFCLVETQAISVKVLFLSTAFVMLSSVASADESGSRYYELRLVHSKNIAKIAMEEGKYEFSSYQLSRALRESLPKDKHDLNSLIAEVYKRWGQQLWQNGKLSSALDKIELSLFFAPCKETSDSLQQIILELKLDPYSTETRIELARDAMRRGNSKAAVVEYEAAYKIKGDYKTLSLLAKHLYISGEYDRAIASYLCLLRDSSIDPETKAQYELKLSQCEYDRKISSERLLKYQPQNSQNSKQLQPAPVRE